MRRFAVHMGIAGALTAAWIIAQPQTPGTTGELAFPSLSTPYTCSDGRKGRVYYDTDDFTPYYCDHNTDTWTSFTFSISGTNPYLARFTSAGTNIEDSIVRATGLPSAGASGNVVDITGSLAAMDGSDTVRGFFVDLVNANHTTGSNNLYGIDVDAITGDAEATEVGINIGTGWDRGVQIGAPSSGNYGILIAAGAGYALRTAGGAFLVQSSYPAANTSGQFMIFGGSPSATNGSDNVSIIDFSLNQVAHTGSNNNFYGINMGGLGGSGPSANVTETAISIGASGETTPWDIDIGFLNDSATHSHFYFQGDDSGEAHITFDSDDATPDLRVKGTGTIQTAIQGGREFTHYMGTDLTVVGSAQTVNPDANVVEITAASAASVSTITAPTSSSHTERVTFICANSNVTFNDADAAGAAGTIDLAGAATNFTCTQDDTITLVYAISPGSGNARWVEVSRSVN